MWGGRGAGTQTDWGGGGGGGEESKQEEEGRERKGRDRHTNNKERKSKNCTVYLHLYKWQDHSFIHSQMLFVRFPGSHYIKRDSQNFRLDVSVAF